MIVENTGKNRIMIVVDWHADPLGGPAIIDTTISVQPGEKLDLSYIGLTPVKKNLGRNMKETK